MTIKESTTEGSVAGGRVERVEESVVQRGGWGAALREAPVAIITVDRDHKVTSWNRAAEAAFGWNEAEILGQTYPLAPPEMEAESRAILRTSLRGEPVVAFETNRRHKDGRLIDVSLSASSFIDERGQPGCIVLISDLTERRRAADEVARLRRRLDSTRGGAYSGDWRWDAATGVLTLCEALREMAGLSQESSALTYDHFLAYVHPADRARVHAKIQKSLEGGTSFRIVFRLVRPSGDQRIVQAIGQRLPGDGDEPRGMFGDAQDVTERRRLLGEVRSSRQQLRALNARLERVRHEERAAMAREIHDQLGQELTGLKMQLAAFASRLPVGPDDLRDQSACLLRLLDQAMQSVRRIAAQLQPPVLDSLGLEAAVETLVASLLGPPGIRCDLRLRLAGLPLPADRSAAIYRILQEILSNVVRHSQARRVAVALERQGGHLVLAVEDDGRGIGHLELRAASSLGLVGISERAGALGGTFQIESTAGSGTRIRVSIPWQGPRRRAAVS